MGFQSVQQKIKRGGGTKQTRVYKYKRIVREMNINTKDGRLNFKMKKEKKNGGPFKLFMYEFGCVCTAPGILVRYNREVTS